LFKEKKRREEKRREEKKGLVKNRGGLEADLLANRGHGIVRWSEAGESGRYESILQTRSGGSR
jgi:hypothetical protein